MTDYILDQTLNIVRPSISYLILKQSSDGSPVSFNLETAYQVNILPSTSYNSRSVNLTGSIYHQISLENESIPVSLIPKVGLLAIQPTNKNGFIIEKQFAMIYNFGISVLWQHAYIEPTVLINSGNLSYTLKVGYIL